ncbi:MAG: hypothetical protein KDA68_09485 [Planctomycetaceae bacterium]|nr:hypothetical protein [Planctomycetaceae bacterium]
MEPEKKQTGLGLSLLLQRTDQQPKPERPAVIPKPEPTVTPVPTEIKTSEADVVPEIPQQNRNKSRQKPKVLRDRCTLYIARDVNEKLDLASRVEDRDRSEIVSELLRKHLPEYTIERKK